MSRPTVVIGNWKMNMKIKETIDFITELSPMLSKTQGKVCLSVPSTLLKVASEAARGSEIEIGAQDVSQYESGAYTGEISTTMIQDSGGEFSLIGHSERRMYYHEDDEMIKEKVTRAILGGLVPVLCVGETQEQKESGQTEKVLLDQLEKALGFLNENEASAVIIAYEPVWAIGTGHAATPEIAQEVHGVIRGFVRKKWGEKNAFRTPILYGGSVSPDTIKELIKMPDIDGALVGGASLKVEAFAKIVNISRETKS
ncbi:triose-phosphate isomerase [Candidatus Aerophobetes bacterium]|uniref:Triosephosphate isomerase n=1 Tax=Aerophobetes bacterium TaxID=2030807 RepID=A0A2A4YKT0_UNCAE|nr:MAG: triose-phosphate isomerase [Candidatus Aerophobetes bacterium]